MSSHLHDNQHHLTQLHCCVDTVCFHFRTACQHYSYKQICCFCSQYIMCTVHIYQR